MWGVGGGRGVSGIRPVVRLLRYSVNVLTKGINRIPEAAVRRSLLARRVLAADTGRALVCRPISVESVARDPLWSHLGNRYSDVRAFGLLKRRVSLTLTVEEGFVAGSVPFCTNYCCPRHSCTACGQQNGLLGDHA